MSRYINAEPYDNDRIVANKEDEGIAVSDVETADVQEVKHGEWLDFIADYSTAECSICGEIYEASGYDDEEHFELFRKLYKYCPNCGARMDGGKNNAE